VISVDEPLKKRGVIKMEKKPKITIKLERAECLSISLQEALQIKEGLVIQEIKSGSAVIKTRRIPKNGSYIEELNESLSKINTEKLLSEIDSYLN